MAVADGPSGRHTPHGPSALRRVCSTGIRSGHQFRPSTEPPVCLLEPSHINSTDGAILPGFKSGRRKTQTRRRARLHGVRARSPSPRWSPVPLPPPCAGASQPTTRRPSLGHGEYLIRPLVQSFRRQAVEFPRLDLPDHRCLFSGGIFCCWIASTNVYQSWIARVVSTDFVSVGS
jgi:hypothetical protein